MIVTALAGHYSITGVIAPLWPSWLMRPIPGSILRLLPQSSASPWVTVTRGLPGRCGDCDACGVGQAIGWCASHFEMNRASSPNVIPPKVWQNARGVSRSIIHTDCAQVAQAGQPCGGSDTGASVRKRLIMGSVMSFTSGLVAEATVLAEAHCCGRQLTQANRCIRNLAGEQVSQCFLHAWIGHVLGQYLSFGDGQTRDVGDEQSVGVAPYRLGFAFQ